MHVCWMETHYGHVAFQVAAIRWLLGVGSCSGETCLAHTESRVPSVSKQVWERLLPEPLESCCKSVDPVLGIGLGCEPSSVCQALCTPSSLDAFGQCWLSAVTSALPSPRWPTCSRIAALQAVGEAGGRLLLGAVKIPLRIGPSGQEEEDLPELLRTAMVFKMGRTSRKGTVLWARVAQTQTDL